MSISKFFWIFLFAVLGISSIIRRDDNFWLFILLVSSGMITIIAMGKWLKDDLIEEWKSLEEKKSVLDRLINPDEKSKFQNQQAVLVREREDLNKDKRELLKQKSDLEEERKRLEVEKRQFEMSPIKKLNPEIFFDAIMQIKATAKNSEISSLETKADEILSEIESKYYRDAFLEYSKKYGDVQELRYKFDEDLYKNSAKRRNKYWANQRWHDLNDVRNNK